MAINPLSKELTTKIRELSAIFNTVVSLKEDEDGFYAEMFISHHKITICIWTLEHQDVEFIANQIVTLVCANFETEWGI